MPISPRRLRSILSAAATRMLRPMFALLVWLRREEPSRLSFLDGLGFHSPRSLTMDYLQLATHGVYRGFQFLSVARARSDPAPLGPTVLPEFKRRLCFRKC